MQNPFDKSILQPGDVILYRPADFFDAFVALKTWAWVSHVECYVGNVAGGAAASVASRNGLGVGKYPVRLDHVAAVLRPGPEFNLDRALDYFKSVEGQKYGWRTLLSFLLLNNNPIDGHQICSEFATNFLAGGGYEVFSSVWPAYRVAPATLLTSRRLPPVWHDGHLFDDLSLGASVANPS